MTDPVYSHPQSRTRVIDSWFLEHRARLIDIAAYLDRLDRSAPDSEKPDFRDTAFRQALDILTDGKPERARRVLLLLSDHSTDLPQSAAGMKGASGAPKVLSNEAAQEGGSL